MGYSLAKHPFMHSLTTLIKRSLPPSLPPSSLSFSPILTFDLSLSVYLSLKKRQEAYKEQDWWSVQGSDAAVTPLSWISVVVGSQTHVFNESYAVQNACAYKHKLVSSNDNNKRE